jgi:hypothetical protein
VKRLVELGQNAQAARMILDEVEKSVGGANEASNKGISGAMMRLHEANKVANESFGESVVKVLHLEGAFSKLAGVLERMNNRAGRNGVEAQIRQAIADLEAEKKALEKGGAGFLDTIATLTSPGYSIGKAIAGSGGADANAENIQWSAEMKKRLAEEELTAVKMAYDANGKLVAVKNVQNDLQKQINAQEWALHSTIIENIRASIGLQEAKKGVDNATLETRLKEEATNLLMSGREKTVKNIKDQILATLDLSPQQVKDAEAVLNNVLDELEARKQMANLITTHASARAAELQFEGKAREARNTAFNASITAYRLEAKEAGVSADAIERNVAAKTRLHNANEALIEQKPSRDLEADIKFVEAQTQALGKLGLARAQDLAIAQQVAEDAKNGTDIAIKDRQAILDKAAAIYTLAGAQNKLNLQVDKNEALAQAKAVNMVGLAKAQYLAILRQEAEDLRNGTNYAVENRNEILASAAAHYQLANATKTAQTGIAEFYEEWRREAMNTGEVVKGFMTSTVSSIESSTSQGFAQGIENMITQAEGFKETFTGIFHSLVQQILQEFIRLFIIKQIMGAIFGGLGGSLGGLVGGGSSGGVSDNLIGMINNGDGTFSDAAGFAKGGTFDHGKVVHFAKGGVIDKRTRVPMAEMGEEGPEAVLPLSRDGQGRLGVRGGGATTNVNVAPSISVTVGSQNGEGPSEAQSRRLGAAIDTSIREKVLEVIERESRPGGILRGSR